MCTTPTSGAGSASRRRSRAGAGTVLRGSKGAGRRSSDGGAAAADVPGCRDARWGAGRAAGGVAALLRAGHVGDGEAARDAQELGGGSAVVILTWLLRPPVLQLELVERCPHGAGVLPFGRAVHIQGARTPHDAILAGANTSDAGVFAHVPVVLPAAPWVTLPHVGQLCRGENGALQLHVRPESAGKVAGLDAHVMALDRCNVLQ